ncbi:MAG: hypothetical protein J7K36_10875 [Archaeoglobaceae archaeon]|nr:hypothetical protein [Archaeoglobaceae archaeon]
MEDAKRLREMALKIGRYRCVSSFFPFLGYFWNALYFSNVNLHLVATFW